MMLAVLLLCALGLQPTLCIYICPGYFGRGFPSPRLPYNAPILPSVSSGFTPLTLDTLAGNRAGSFKVVSSSPRAPTGITLVSQNSMDGPLFVTGEIPFIGAVSIDGSLPAGGTGAVDYECGGAPAVLNEVLDATAPVISPSICVTAPTSASIEIGVPASISAEIVAPAALYRGYGPAFPSANILVSPSVLAPKATAIAPVFGRFGFRRNFRGFGLGYR